jgi:hypothetical protein
LVAVGALLPRRYTLDVLTKEVLDAVSILQSLAINNHKHQGLKQAVYENPGPPPRINQILDCLIHAKFTFHFHKTLYQMPVRVLLERIRVVRIL